MCLRVCCVYSDKGCAGDDAILYKGRNDDTIPSFFFALQSTHTRSDIIRTNDICFY